MANNAAGWLLNPWAQAGMLGLGALGGAVAHHNAPSQMDVGRRKLDFFMEGMNKIPGLADLFRRHMMRGSGGEQANMLGGVEQFRSGFQKSMLDRGLGRTALAGLGESMSRSMAGRGSADIHGKYNLASFGMADQNMMQALQQILGGWQQSATKQDILGALLGAGGRAADRTLYPRG